MDKINLGHYLKEKRLQKGLYQREVAYHLNIDTAFVSKLESGEKNPSRTHLNKLSQLFEVELAELEKLWLANKVYSVIKEEEHSLAALRIAEKIVEYKKKK